MNLLFLNVGRRCELVEYFRRSLDLRGGGRIFGSDVSPLAPGLQVVDHPILFPWGDSPEFPDAILSFCRDNEIHLVIPTIDPDLFRLDALREIFAKEVPSCRLLLAPSFTLRLARDKRMSKKMFAELGATVPADVSHTQPGLSFPVFVKPYDGSSGKDAEVVNDMDALNRMLRDNPKLMVEPVIAGPEYTVDVLCDFEGHAICAIPRRRLKVREGEVAQGVIERIGNLEALAMKLAMGCLARGPVTIQFRNSCQAGFVAMEMNARMGGGLPLSIAAGADWPGWILDLCSGRTPDTGVDITDGLVMTRFDRSIFLSASQIEGLKDPPKPVRIPESLMLERLRKAAAWIFDMDDTIYPERDFVISAYRAVANKVYEDFAIDIEGSLRERFLRGERGDLFSRVLREFDIPVKELYVKSLVDVYRSHSPAIKPYVDVIPTLMRLRKGGAKIGLVSDGWGNVQRNKLAALDVEHLFDSVVLTDEINGKESWKPAADGFTLCLKRLEINPVDAVFIGDNPAKDFIGAKQLGMLTIRIRRRGCEHEHEKAACPEYEPHFSVNSFRDISDILARANQQWG